MSNRPTDVFSHYLFYPNPFTVATIERLSARTEYTGW